MSPSLAGNMREDGTALSFPRWSLLSPPQPPTAECEKIHDMSVDIVRGWEIPWLVVLSSARPSSSSIFSFAAQGGGVRPWVILGADDSYFQSEPSACWGFLEALPKLSCPEAQQREGTLSIGGMRTGFPHCDFQPPVVFSLYCIVSSLAICFSLPHEPPLCFLVPDWIHLFSIYANIFL